MNTLFLQDRERRKLKKIITSAAGFPPTEMHSISTSRSSVVRRVGPCTILGGSGGTNTETMANLDLIGG